MNRSSSRLLLSGSLLAILGATGFARSGESRVDNGLARTPPTGWNSWSKFGCDVSDDLIRGIADRWSSVLSLVDLSSITASWERVGLRTKRARVRDLWAHTETAVVEDRYAAMVPSHGVVMLRVWPIAN